MPIRINGSTSGYVELQAPAVAGTTIVTLPSSNTSLVNATPFGAVIPFAGSTAPEGWLLCDGSVVSRTTYASLFAVISTTYNTGGEAGTDFRLPNMKGRIPVGIDSTQTEFDVLGETGGSKTSTAPHTHGVTLDHDHASFNATSGTESQTHSHYVSQYTNTANSGTNYYLATVGSNAYGSYNTGGASVTHTHTTTIDVPAFTGSNTSGASSAAATSGNLQPYISLNYIIKAL